MESPRDNRGPTLVGAAKPRPAPSFHRSRSLAPLTVASTSRSSEDLADAVMATNNQSSFRDELASYNRDLESCLKERVGMSFKTFKTIKALTQLVGACAGAYAMSQSADPGLMMILITTCVSGPEVLEYLIESQGDGSGDSE